MAPSRGVEEYSSTVLNEQKAVGAATSWQSKGYTRIPCKRNAYWGKALRLDGVLNTQKAPLGRAYEGLERDFSRSN